MNVKLARQIVKDISAICDLLGEFDKANEELSNTYEVPQARDYLADYKKLLENAIDSAELKFI